MPAGIFHCKLTNFSLYNYELFGGSYFMQITCFCLNVCPLSILKWIFLRQLLLWYANGDFFFPKLFINWTFVRKSCCFSPISLCTHLFMSVWTYGYLYHSWSYNTIFCYSIVPTLALVRYSNIFIDKDGNSIWFSLFSVEWECLVLAIWFFGF